MKTIVGFFLLAAASHAVIHENPGGKRLPHDAYVHVVSEAESPVEQVYIQSRDGVYVAAAMRKPGGPGPFPVLIHFHGAPGGRGMEKLVQWSRGDTGGPVWERFLREGFVVVVADYRHMVGRPPGQPLPEKEVTYLDDGLAVLEHVRKLPYVDPQRITLYGVSLGGNVVMHMLSRTTVQGAILGAPAPMGFLGVTYPGGAPAAGTPAADRFKQARIDPERSQRNIATVQTPVLILVGTADSLLPIDRELHDLLEKAGKPVRMEIYENGYHDFVMGPQGHEGRDEPLMDATMDALEKSLAFARKGLAGLGR